MVNIGTPSYNSFTADTNGKIGGCYKGNGLIYHFEDQLLQDRWTIAMWVKCSAFSSNNNILFCQNTTAADASIYLSILSNTRINLGINGGAESAGYYTYTFAADTWYHIAVTYDKPNYVIYLNGSQAKTGTRNVTSYTGHNNIGLGCRSSNATGTSQTGGAGSNGTMRNYNDFRIYDTALSPREIKEIAKGLVLHYPLSGIGQENLIIDSQGLATSCSSANKNCSKRGTSTRRLNNYGFYESQVTASFGGIAFYANQLNLQVGDILTYSFYIYINGSTKNYSFYPMMYNSSGTRDTSTGIETSLDGGSYTTVNSKSFGSISSNIPEKHYVTFIWNQNVKDIIDNGGRIELSIQIHGNWQTGDFGSIFAPKLEKGIIATPWLPNSADPEYTALGLNDNIEYDVSGYKNNGTKNGTIIASSSTARYTTSSVFNGSSYIKNTNFNLTHGIWTVAAWYYLPNSISSYNCILCLSKGDGSDANKKFAMCPNASYVWFKIENTSTSVNSALKVNQWTHIVLTSNGTNGKVYVNGQQAATTNITSIYTDCTDLVIGARASAENATTIAVPLNGYVSDVRIYATTLSAEDIQELYHTPITLSSNGTLLTQGEYVEV